MDDTERLQLLLDEFHQQCDQFADWRKDLFSLALIIKDINSMFAKEDNMRYWCIINKDFNIVWRRSYYDTSAVEILELHSLEGVQYLIKNHEELIRKVIRSPWN